MNNNPFQILQALQNPAQMMPELMKDRRFFNDPRAMKTITMFQNHDTDGLKSMAINMCREYGTTPEEVGNKIKNQFGL